jgi:hypothetical protein
MDKVENARCIYIQKSSTQHTEKEMVRIVTLLQKYLDNLGKIVAEVRDHKRICDAACCLEQFTLFNLCRNTTMELMTAIAVWQQGFTRVLRPILMESDYMIKLIKAADFYCDGATYLRRYFNFSLGTKNLLFLPMPNPRTIEPVMVSPELLQQVKDFAAPPLEKILGCYQILINSIPRPIFNKIFPIDVWLRNRWIPLITPGPYTQLAHSKHIAGLLNKKDDKSKDKKKAGAVSGAASKGVSRSEELFLMKLASKKSGKSVASSKRSVGKRRSPTEFSDTDNNLHNSPGMDLATSSNKFSDLDFDEEGAGSLTIEGDDNDDEDKEESEIDRLSRLYVPKEKVSLLQVYMHDEMMQEVLGSIDLSQGTLSGGPPPPPLEDIGDIEDLLPDIDGMGGTTKRESNAANNKHDGKGEHEDKGEDDDDNRSKSPTGSIIVDDISVSSAGDEDLDKDDEEQHKKITEELMKPDAATTPAADVATTAPPQQPSQSDQGHSVAQKQQPPPTATAPPPAKKIANASGKTASNKGLPPPRPKSPKTATKGVKFQDDQKIGAAGKDYNAKTLEAAQTTGAIATTTAAVVEARPGSAAKMLARVEPNTESAGSVANAQSKAPLMVGAPALALLRNRNAGSTGMTVDTTTGNDNNKGQPPHSLTMAAPSSGTESPTKSPFLNSSAKTKGSQPSPAAATSQAQSNGTKTNATASTGKLSVEQRAARFSLSTGFFRHQQHDSHHHAGGVGITSSKSNLTNDDDVSVGESDT